MCRDGSDRPRETVTSMKLNTQDFIPKALESKVKKAYTYIDFPGHGSQRSALTSHLKSARAVVFVVRTSLSLSLSLSLDTSSHVHSLSLSVLTGGCEQ